MQLSHSSEGRGRLPCDQRGEVSAGPQWVALVAPSGIDFDSGVNAPSYHTSITESLVALSR